MATRVSLPVAPLAVSRTSVALDSANTARLLPRTRRRCAGQSACAGRRSAGWSDGTSARSSPDDGRAHRPWQAASGSDAGRSTAPPSGPCDHGLPRPIVVTDTDRGGRRCHGRWPGRSARAAAAGGEPVEQLLRAARSSSCRERRRRITGRCSRADPRPRSSTGSAGSTTRWCCSTHGVNCTGSCSWKVFVKDGIITWETQQTDYPSTGPDSPEYEPRGCPRGLVLLVHVLAVAGALPVRARPAAGDVAGGPRRGWVIRSRPGRRSRATRSGRPGTRGRGAWAGSFGPPGPR